MGKTNLVGREMSSLLGATTHSVYDVSIAATGVDNVQLFTLPKTWEAAKLDCERRGSRLVDVQDDQERDWIMATVYNTSCAG